MLHIVTVITLSYHLSRKRPQVSGPHIISIVIDSRRGKREKRIRE
jgi:hypothetical protein